MLELNLKGSPRMVAGIVVIILVGWGIISSWKLLLSVYATHHRAVLNEAKVSRKNNCRIFREPMACF